MSEFLETLKIRMTDAQRRLQVAQANLQRAQVEHGAVMAEFSSWQNAVAVESRKEEQAKIIQANIQLPVKPTPITQPSTTVNVAAQSQSTPSSTDVNKASLIREVLRQHPNGITPVEVWRAVKDRQVDRAYVYSVLKRLKDKKQALQRRGKYVLVVEAKAEEAKEKTLTVQ